MSGRESAPGLDTAAAPPPAARPYRSHKVPACDRCRKRKIRCIVDISGHPCLLCRANDIPCIKTKERGGTSSTGERPAKRRQTEPATQVSNDVAAAGERQLGSENARGAIPTSGENAGEKGERAAMIVGPVAAEDIHIIEEYMTSKRSPEEVRDGSYNVISNDPAKPILYLSVPARRKGLGKPGELPGSAQREIIEQILGPLAPNLTSVYFEHIHSWFPILDAGNLDFSPALRCGLYATSLIYWHQSDELKKHPQPDTTYAWNLAVAALQEEFLSPSLDTLYAALLDLNGRPVTSITGNIITSGKTVALAHSLGLNRDPRSWNIPKDEKHARIRLWWGVLIHDRWSSFAHGVPATIAKDQYDVPQPDITVLRLSSSKHEEHGRDSFFALCDLTEILADILPMVYNLQAQRYKDSPRKLRRVQIQIDDWEESLPDWLRLSIEEGPIPQPGACSLQLSLLAIKMLVCRIALRDVVRSQETEDKDSKEYHQSELRKSAQALVSFVCSLQRSHLQEFWLPYSAYHIASAAIVLLRFSIDTAHLDIVNTCKSSLQQLMTRLHQAKETEDWDMGDICLAQCNDSIAAITAAHDMLQISEGQNLLIREPGETREPLIEAQEAGIPSFLSTQNTWGFADDLQYPWANLWDLEPQGSMY